ncbi:MAG: hypothetical protein ACE5GD_11265, partial [Candidatus Geothermarchaeales archaeon]
MQASGPRTSGMKTLLVNPPSKERVYSWLKSVSATYPTLGLAYLASSLEKDGLEVDILDANAHGYALEETIDRILKTDA